MKKGHLRWWRVIDGEIERIVSVECPGDGWTRGMGPSAPEVRERRKQKLRELHLGKPKSAEHRLRMREAKLGVPKSAEHVAAKTLAAQHRVKLIKQVMLEQNIGWYEAMPLVPRKNK